MPSPDPERLAELRVLRDELRQEMETVNDSVRWLRAELRVATRAQPRVTVASVVYAACALGALAGAGLAVCAR